MSYQTLSIVLVCVGVVGIILCSIRRSKIGAVVSLAMILSGVLLDTKTRHHERALAASRIEKLLALEVANSYDLIETNTGRYYLVTGRLKGGYLRFKKVDDLPSADVLLSADIAPWIRRVIYTSDPDYKDALRVYLHQGASPSRQKAASQ